MKLKTNGKHNKGNNNEEEENEKKVPKIKTFKAIVDMYF